MLSYLLSVLAGFSFTALCAAPRSQFPPPLEKEEEDRLFHRWRDTGDMAAREKLIEHNLRLVSHVVRKYYAASPDKDDLVSIGSIGLIKAVETFRPEAGRLAAYASRCIENEILMHLRANRKNRNTVSLEEPIGTDREGNDVRLIDLIGSDENLVPDEAETNIESSRVKKLIPAVLDERERRVVSMRYGLADGVAYPQHAVARALGISRSYVSRIEKKALEKLNRALNS